MKNLFTELQSAIADCLRADEFLAMEPAPRIITEVLGDIGSAIERDLGARGLSIAVATPEIARGSEVVLGELDVEVLVDVSERPMLNRGASGTQKAAVDVAFCVIGALWYERLTPAFSRLSFIRSNLVSATPDRVTYEVRFSTKIRVQKAVDDSASS